MTRRLLTLAAAALFATAAHAQTITANQLSERLQISPTTAEAVVDVLDGIEHQPGFLWTAAAELAEQLSPEQLEELLAVRAVSPHVRRQARTDGARPARQSAVSRMIHAFDDLTPEQRTQLEALHQRTLAQVREMAQQARAGDVDRAELRRQRQELHRGVMTEAQSILTEEQQARARQMFHRFQEARQGARTDDGPRHRQTRRLDADERREMMQAQREARRSALNLSRDQLGQLEEAREMRRQHMRERRSGEQATERRRAIRQPAMRDRREVLTEDQRTIARLHAVLNRAMMQRGQR